MLEFATIENISKAGFRVCALAAVLTLPVLSQTSPLAGDSQPTIQALMDRLAAAEARIQELEQRNPPGKQAQQAPPVQALAQTSIQPAASASALLPAPDTASTNSASAVATSAATDDDPHAHMMEIPGGPTLKIRGFFDFNYGLGPDANPLQFPLGAPAHNTFQAGEFDLFITSKLSDHLDFVSEIVFGSDQTNVFSIDLERYLLTYRKNEYFKIGAGRYHTAIGYYNTAYHHGTWFGTAEGRPFMYYYEDSGGLLPVHNVGITAEGLVPGTGSLHVHWIAEGGNGRASSPNAIEPVQNYLSDRNHKSYNLAFYLKPEWAPGLQVGGSYYRDRLVPVGARDVSETITSAYAVYISPKWEFLNEAVLLTNKEDGVTTPFHTPLMYTQISRGFGKYRPYFRYQYVNSPANDPINVYTDRYQGPSVGVRWDFSDFAAFKLQYNRLDQRAATSNSVNAQMGFTF
jgi:hypothetical protein